MGVRGGGGCCVFYLLRCLVSTDAYAGTHTLSSTHTRARAHTHMHARTHARTNTHASKHTHTQRTHARVHTNACTLANSPAVLRFLFLFSFLIWCVGHLDCWTLVSRTLDSERSIFLFYFFGQVASEKPDSWDC